MKTRTLLIAMAIISLIGICSAESPYGKGEIYWNGEKIDPKDIPRPTLDIGEPRTVRLEFILYQDSRVYMTLYNPGGHKYFDVLDGPSEWDEYAGQEVGTYETAVFEWTIAPNENAKLWSMPINFAYTIYDANVTEKTSYNNWGLLANSGGTIAIASVTDQYYQGPIPEAPSTVTTADTATNPSSLPGFSAMLSIITLVGASLIRRV